MKPLCETRWTVRERALNHVLLQSPLLLDALDEISTWRGQEVGLAAGLATRLQRTTTYFALLVARALFGACETLAIALQANKASHHGTLKDVRILEERLALMSNDAFLRGLWAKTEEAETRMDLKEPAPRRARAPTQKAAENGVQPEIALTTKERSLKEAKEAILLVRAKLGERFSSPGFKFVLLCQSVLLAVVGGKVLEVEIRELVAHLKDDLDIDRFKQQLPNLQDDDFGGPYPLEHLDSRSHLFCFR